MKNRSFLCTEIKLLYDEISKKRNMDKEMRIQADREFEQNEIKRTNKKFTCLVRKFTVAKFCSGTNKRI